jgi:hypothetical protein
MSTPTDPNGRRRTFDTVTRLMTDDPVTWSEVDPRMFDQAPARRLASLNDVVVDQAGADLDWARYWRIAAAVIATVYLVGTLLLVLR